MRGCLQAIAVQKTRDGRGGPGRRPAPLRRSAPPPPVRRCQAVTATVPTFSWLPENYGILHDASWCPKTRRCGGAVAVFCPVTLRYQLYPVPIPLRLDNAYTAELYTAWVALAARGLQPTLPSASDPVRGTLRTAKGTSQPKRGAASRRTRYKGIS